MLKFTGRVWSSSIGGVYLMKEDEGPLKGIVDLLVDWVSDDLPLHLPSPQSEVVIPELVAEEMS